MVKIYKKDRLIIIEGVGQFVPETLSFVVTEGRVTITSDGLKRNVFDAIWSVIRREDESPFSTAVELETYLTETLTTSSINIDGGIIF